MEKYFRNLIYPLRVALKELLLEIKNEDPDMFSESVNEVIELI